MNSQSSSRLEVWLEFGFIKIPDLEWQVLKWERWISFHKQLAFKGVLKNAILHLYFFPVIVD